MYIHTTCVVNACFLCALWVTLRVACMYIRTCTCKQCAVNIHVNVYVLCGSWWTWRVVLLHHWQWYCETWPVVYWMEMCVHIYCSYDRVYQNRVVCVLAVNTGHYRKGYQHTNVCVILHPRPTTVTSTWNHLPIFLYYYTDTSLLRYIQGPKLTKTVHSFLPLKRARTPL